MQKAHAFVGFTGGGESQYPKSTNTFIYSTVHLNKAKGGIFDVGILLDT